MFYEFRSPNMYITKYDQNLTNAIEDFREYFATEQVTFDL